MKSADVRRRTLQTRAAIVIVMLLIGLAILGLYAAMKQIAAARKAAHKVSFYQYVTLHHIGTLTNIDDGTGFDPNSYVLTLSSQIPAASEQEYVTSLMKRYVEYDNGQLLTIVYQDPRTHAQHPVATVHYDDDEHVLTVALTMATGKTERIVKHVDWN
ncbi:MAG: hypothetical protein K6T83_11565 [Alicyclobacillus sp.]|nr:hypothetical protein [Alicyclobacillus sp.]